MHSWPIETIRANHSIGRPIIANGQDFSGLLSLRLVWENSVSGYQLLAYQSHSKKPG